MNGLINHALEANLLAEAMRHHARYVSRALDPRDYGDPAHQSIAEAIQAVWQRGETVGFEAVQLELQRSGRDALTGGMRGLAAIAGSFANAVPDGQELKRLRHLRELHTGGLDVAKYAEAGRLDEALTRVSELDSQVHTEAQTLSELDLAEATLRGLTERTPRAHLGLASMHHAIGALPAGAVMTLGADTNVGKTSVALEMLFAAVEEGETVGFVSMEDPVDVTGARILSMQSGISSRRIQQRRLNPCDFDALGRAVDAIKRRGERFLYEDHSGGTEVDVCGAMTRMASRGARLIVVDYIQEIESSKAKQDRRNEIRWIMRRLKSHARRLSVALVLVSQLSRPKDDGKSREPSKHSLKEAGDLENASEVVVVLWRDREDDFAVTNVKVVKCKWGGVGQRWAMVRNRDSGRILEVEGAATNALGGPVVQLSPLFVRGRDE